MLKFIEFVQIQNENNGQETELWNPRDTTSNMMHPQVNNQQHQGENLPPLKDVIQNLYSNLKKQQIEKSKLNQTKYVSAPPLQAIRKKSVFSRIVSKFI
jgi:hypothetical protein